jgi:membrane protein DedA with SNARE-associated domain
MTLGTLIGTHGYWVLALGCLLEGETILLLAGFAVHRGYLDPVAVVGVASVAGFIGDQFWFWLGRRHGAAVLTRWPSIARQTDRVRRLLDRFHAAVIIGVRFAYGLRIAGPVLIGTTPLPALRFAALNALGAVLWACVIAGIGWVFGQAAETMLGEIRHLEGWLLLGLAGAAAVAWWIRKSRTN